MSLPTPPKESFATAVAAVSVIELSLSELAIAFPILGFLVSAQSRGSKEWIRSREPFSIYVEVCCMVFTT